LFFLVQLLDCTGIEVQVYTLSSLELHGGLFVASGYCRCSYSKLWRDMDLALACGAASDDGVASLFWVMGYISVFIMARTIDSVYVDVFSVDLS